jgi:hypothetical protein
MDKMDSRPTPSRGQALRGTGFVKSQINPLDKTRHGVEATLNQCGIDPSWRQAIEQRYVIETPFVNLSASGVNDGQGRAMLRLAAATADSRLVVVIDNTYISLLDVIPQDGYLETSVRLGPSEAGSAEHVGSLSPGGSMRFSVLTPNTTASASSKSHLSKAAFQDPGSCGIDLDTYFAGINHCRRSADGSVKVNFL